MAPAPRTRCAVRVLKFLMSCTARCAMSAPNSGTASCRSGDDGRRCGCGCGGEVCVLGGRNGGRVEGGRREGEEGRTWVRGGRGSGGKGRKGDGEKGRKGSEKLSCMRVGARRSVNWPAGWSSLQRPDQLRRSVMHVSDAWQWRMGSAWQLRMGQSMGQPMAAVHGNGARQRRMATAHGSGAWGSAWGSPWQWSMAAVHGNGA
eukprot:360558-Chlamydomonas_euryale.AAC.1